MTTTETTVRRKYYVMYPRGFGNEYTVAMATDDEASRTYESNDRWERISRRDAERKARYSGDAATQAYVRYEVDGQPVYPDEWMQATL